MKKRVYSLMMITMIATVSTKCPAQASVSIEPVSDPIITEGQHVQLTADVSGGTSPCYNYVWLDGDGLKVSGDTNLGASDQLNYTPAKDDDGTDDDVVVQVYDQNWNWVGSDDIDLYVAKLEHQTEENAMSALGDRTLLGLGEQVDCKIMPEEISEDQNVTWSVSSGATNQGSVSQSTGPKTTYTTACYVGTETVEADISDGTSLTVNFTSILPTVVNRGVSSDRLPYGAILYGHVLQFIASNMFAYGPDSVNFYNLTHYEGICAASTSGYFLYCQGQEHGTAQIGQPNSDIVQPGKGTISLTEDACQQNTNGGGPNFSNGTFVWVIPQIMVCQGIVNPSNLTSTQSMPITVTSSPNQVVLTITKTDGFEAQASWPLPLPGQ